MFKKTKIRMKRPEIVEESKKNRFGDILGCAPYIGINCKYVYMICMVSERVIVTVLLLRWCCRCCSMCIIYENDRGKDDNNSHNSTYIVLEHTYAHIRVSNLLLVRDGGMDY